MAQITTGLRRVLGHPFIYELFQFAVGGPAARRRYIREFIRPFPGARILDIGCGPGTILDHLPSSTEYVGYDLDPNYIADAKRKYGDRGEFHCATAGDPSMPLPADRFDIIMANGLLHHLNDDEVETLLDNSRRWLKPGGVLITLDCVYAPDQSRAARYLISKDRGKSVRSPEGYRSLVARKFGAVEATVLHDMLRIPYSHIIMRATKEQAGIGPAAESDSPR